MHPTMPPIFTAPAAPSTRRTAAGVRADRRSPAGLGLDPREDRRTLATAGTANTQKVPFTQITCIMPMFGRRRPRSFALSRSSAAGCNDTHDAVAACSHPARLGCSSHVVEPGHCLGGDDQTRNRCAASPVGSHGGSGRDRSGVFQCVLFETGGIRVGAGQTYGKVYLSWLSRGGQSPPLNYPVDGHDVTGVIDPVDVSRRAARV